MCPRNCRKHPECPTELEASERTAPIETRQAADVCPEAGSNQFICDSGIQLMCMCLGSALWSLVCSGVSRGFLWPVSSGHLNNDFKLCVCQNCLRRRDTGLISQLQELDRQICDLRLDTETSHEQPETDSRPSSGKSPVVSDVCPE